MNSDLIIMLNKILAAFDEGILKSNIEWAFLKKAEFNAFRDTREYRTYNEGDFLRFGGKTWFRIFSDNPMEYIEKIVIKNHEAMIKKRNGLISKKMADLDITSVTFCKKVFSKDGFEGVFRICTNKGEKTVTIQVIYAGGYNIQCLHTRTLVKIK